MFKKGLALVMIIPLIMFVIAGCGSNDQSGETGVKKKAEPVDGELKPLEKEATVTIAEDGSASGAGFYIAKEKGYFEDYNINVEFTKFSNSDQMMPALAAGKIDIAGGISSASFFNSIAQGINVKMIADKGHNLKGQSYFSFVIRKGLQDEIQSYKDFKGKTIAVSTKNGVDDYIFSQMLEHAGLTRDDVQFELMSNFGNMTGSMANKQIDAALQIEPLITKGVQQGVHVPFGDATDYAPKAQIAMVLGSPKFVNERQKVALRFMVAYLKGVRDYNDAFVKNKGGKDEVIKIMTQHTSLQDPEIWKKVRVTGLNPNGRMFVDNIKDQYKWYQSRGAIKGNLNFDKAVDTSLIEKAVDVLGEYK